MSTAGDVLDLHVRRHVVDARLVLPLTGPPVTVLFGPSGAGKTTVLRTVAGLDATQGGYVVAGGQVWDDGSRRRVPARRRGVGYLSQDPALFPHLGVRANVGYGLHGCPRATRSARVARALDAVGAISLADRAVPQLSGGQAQRVALARALAPRPRLLLLDEPLAALDDPTRRQLRSELRRILVGARVPALVVTHDRAEALALADQVVVLVDGTVRQIGSPAVVFDRPADADVARAVGMETAADGVVLAAIGPLVRVGVGGAQLLASPGQEALPAGRRVLVCVRAEDVRVHPAGLGPPQQEQVNVLAGTVTAVLPEGALVRLDLDAGARLVAYVTRREHRDLALAPGSPVTLSVAAADVHLVCGGDRNRQG